MAPLNPLALRGMFSREALLRGRDALEGRYARLFMDKPDVVPYLFKPAQALLDGEELLLPDIAESKFIRWDQPGGMKMGNGDFTNRPRKMEDIRLIVVHWGGLDPAHCRRVLDGVNYSSHFGVGRAKAYQWLDMTYKAWHAGSRANAQSIGIDICQTPRVELLTASRSRGYTTRVIDNPTDRGPDRILTIDPLVAVNTRDLVLGLCAALNIPEVTPGHHEVLTAKELREFTGVIGHHHIKPGKWDEACWHHEIFRNTPLDIKE